MKTLNKCHVKAFTEVFELVLVGSVIALVADTGWVAHDIYHNGFNWQYGFIGSGLVTATTLTIWACIKHHTMNFRKFASELLQIKLARQKHKNKRRNRG